MQTTLNLDEDLAKAAVALAGKQSKRLEQVVTELLRDWVAGDRQAQPPFRIQNGLPLVNLPPHTPSADPALIRQAMDEDL